MSAITNGATLWTSDTGLYSIRANNYTTSASGNYSHAEGQKTTASGTNSHAEGDQTTASGTNSHAEGYQTYAVGYASHAEGNNTVASGDHSHAGGVGTVARYAGEWVRSNYGYDASYGFLDYSKVTTNNTTTELYLNYSFAPDERFYITRFKFIYRH